MDDRIKRITLNYGSALSIIATSIIFGVFGYLDIYAIIAEFLIMILSFIFLFFSNINARSNIIDRLIYVYIFMGMLIFIMLALAFIRAPYSYILSIIIASIFSFLAYKYYKGKLNLDFLENRNLNFKAIYIILSLIVLIIIFSLHFYLHFIQQDEYYIDVYSAIQFMSGRDPYIPYVTASVFSHFNMINYQLFSTPTMNGSFVTLMGYPALSFLVYVPYVLIGKYNNFIISILIIIPFFLIYKTYENKKIALYALFGLLINIFVLYYGIVGLIGLLWAVLLMTSYFFRKNYRLSGIFYGLSLSAKQFPALVFPYIIYMIYKTHGLKKTFYWLIYGAGIFFLINGYFIIKSPYIYFKDILSSETLKIYGIGEGISQISFLNYAYVPSNVFTGIMVIIFLVTIIVYIKYYDILKYELFAFPALFFLFNYRVLPGYFIFWTMISLLTIANINKNDLKKEINTKKIKKFVYYIIIFSLVIIIVLGFININHEDPVTFESISPTYNHGKLTGFNITVKYSGDKRLYFRGIANESISNGILFNSQEIYSNGDYKIYKITLIKNEIIYNNSALELIAYNGTVLGSNVYKIQNGEISVYHGILYNPPRNRISLSQTQL
ncbi:MULTISPECIES: hypothetical protein [unclassified Acidiplasma]|uniref:hypothetical protein n=2 Tax=Acidiplasma TaxID=507753 RepID=UPI0005DF3033|nr:MULTISPECIES: hypothetical protein [unclassified Acidiplasma]KJE49752.1 hypothetical protein TZ01_01215 [Acidiplasma sp. MBA-1]WMT55706.1 MAG: hypothetical protein RE470_03425 [Acidiplasma sp.]